MPLISVVVPVYRAGDTLYALHNRLTESLSALSADYEIIFVEDGGGDNSWNIITELVNRDKRVKAIQHLRNYGQHNALLRGIRAANGDVIVTIDDDLQHPPEEIPKLLAKLEEGFDVVYGAPYKEQHGFFRDISSIITKLTLQIVMGTSTARKASAFRAFRTHIRKAFADYESPFVSIDVLLTWGAARFTAISVRHDERLKGKSNYTFRKLLVHAVNMITGFSTFPLQLASLIGFAFTFFGLLTFAYVIGRYLMLGGSVPGFPFLASVISIFSGAQLFSLGIIGEYLARMHFRSMGRPYSVVRGAVGIEEDNAKGTE